MRYIDLCEIYQKLEKNSKRLKKIEILSNFLKQIKKTNEEEIIYLLQGKIFPDYVKKEFGISEKLCIKALSKVSGISLGQVIKKWKKFGDLGIVAEKIILEKTQSTLFFEEITIKKVLADLQKITELKGIGAVDKKLAIISGLLNSARSIEAKYIIRTLLTDLRIGLGEGTLRDSIVSACFKFKDITEKKLIANLIQEAYNKCIDFKLIFEKSCEGMKSLNSIDLIPGRPMKVMLFLKEKTIEEGFKRVGKPCLIDYKYDGFRIIITKEKNKKIKTFTRRLEEVSEQFPEIIEYVSKYVNAESFILDAEAIGFDLKKKTYKPFQDISQRIKRKYHIKEIAKKLPIEINVFDIIYYNGKNLIKEPLKERRKILEKIIKQEKYKLKLSEAIITGNLIQAEKFYEKALNLGEEGIMMKNLDAPYKPGARVGYGIKIKPIGEELDLVITNAEYGTGKRAGWLTSYTLSCKNKEELLEIGKASTGLKEKEELGLSFKELTKKLKPLIKKEIGRKIIVKPDLVVTIIYQNIQKSPTYNSGYALRFPRIIRLRPDRSIKDIADIKEITKEFEKQK